MADNDDWKGDDIWSNLRAHWDESAERERPQREAVAHPAMEQVNRLVADMRNSGWRVATDCPKDGTMFWAWDPLNTLPYHCNYQGEWPKGSWWAYMDGDVWPARPVLFRPMMGKWPESGGAGS